MTTSLSDFLEERAAQEAAERETRQANVTEWRTAVARLLRQIEDWVRAADTRGILEVEYTQTVLSEAGLGRYSVSQLEISGFGNSMSVVPRARYTVVTGQPPNKESFERAAGRVDLTDGTRRVTLLRFRADSDDIWMIDEVPSRRFDREAFEAILMSFLQ
jgi:hypothetical protein